MMASIPKKGSSGSSGGVTKPLLTSPAITETKKGGNFITQPIISKHPTPYSKPYSGNVQSKPETGGASGGHISGGSGNASADPHPPVNGKPNTAEAEEQERSRARQEAERLRAAHEADLTRRDLQRDVGYNLREVEYQFFGDSLPINRTALMQYVFAENDWDESGVRTNWSWNGEVLRRTGATSIDQDITSLTGYLFGQEIHGINAQNSQELAQQIIADVQGVATNFGIELGDTRGLSAYEILELYTTELAQRFRELSEDSSNEIVNEYPSIISPEDIVSQFHHWKGLQNTFGTDEDLTPDVYHWLIHELQSNPNSTIPIETQVRNYLLSQFRGIGAQFDPEDLSTLSLRDLTLLYGERQQRQYDNLTEEYEARTGLTWLSDSALMQLEMEASLARNTQLDMLIANFTSEQMNEMSMLVENISASRARLERTGDLLLAYDMQYEEPTADHSLLLLLGTIVFEPLDWIVTGVEIVQDIKEGDYASAGINTGLLLFPFVSGSLDNIIRYAPDEPIGGGYIDNAFRSNSQQITINLGNDSVTLNQRSWGGEYNDLINIIESEGHNFTRENVIEIAQIHPTMTDIPNVQVAWLEVGGFRHIVSQNHIKHIEQSFSNLNLSGEQAVIDFLMETIATQTPISVTSRLNNGRLEYSLLYEIPGNCYRI